MATSADPTADQSQSTKPIKNSRLGAVVPQNRDTNCRYEVRLVVQNVGNTPAYKGASNLYTDVLPNPLPADFEIPAFDPAMTGQGPAYDTRV